MEKIEFSQNAAEVDREKPYTAETFRKVGQEKLAHLTAIKELMEADGYDRLIYSPGPDYDNGPLLEYIRTTANQYRDIGVTSGDQIIGLSTCVDAQTTERAVLFGRLEE